MTHEAVSFNPTDSSWDAESHFIGQPRRRFVFKRGLNGRVNISISQLWDQCCVSDVDSCSNGITSLPSDQRLFTEFEMVKIYYGPCHRNERPSSILWQLNQGDITKLNVYKIVVIRLDKLETDIKIVSFWDLTPYIPLKDNRRFRGTCCLHLLGWRISQVRDQN
jgi:hypothetical protein